MGVLLSLFASLRAEAVDDPAMAAAASPTVGVVQVVAGIVGYTRWPSEAPATVRLCTLGQGAAVDELLRHAGSSTGARPLSVRAADGHPQPWLDCDALYLGQVDAQASRAMLQGLSGRPVLVLGEGTGFCTDGGMFCIDATSPAPRFQANLDAIARSGLRVNPLVLRIARPSSRSGS
ncbi:MAG: YfiR family protein [Rubrivivax sp.]|nr:YfiR family protein [Rubrivivax sp.]